jgi:hypothetical protein
MAQVQVVSRLGIIARVAGLQKLKNGLLRGGPPKRIFWLLSSCLTVQETGDKNDCNKREGARFLPRGRKHRPEIWVHLTSFAWNVAERRV